MKTWLAAVVLLSSLGATAQSADQPPRGQPAPRVAIVVDDLGYRLAEGLAALELPGPVSYSFLPDTPHATRLALIAHGLGRDVLLHLPMESTDPAPLGPGGITSEMPRAEVAARVDRALDAIPHAVGLNNHMGSLLTTDRERMQWLMQVVAERGDLFFLDSRTSPASVAREVAHERGVPSVARDVFLDHEPDPAFILGQFRRLVQIARERGGAVGIAHPYPETISVLRVVLPLMERYGVHLVPVSTLVSARVPRSVPSVTAASAAGRGYSSSPGQPAMMK